ncbi:NHL repeat protein [Legionella sainthelensi]|uniref:NHL repeat protein n=1 Tax=Legionella sainthelensi TaxID=28087 RepID=A0A0W0YF32_9GAMM|nr:hypothetical protein [Legionella sainthelensi]KTD55252.1 NHL repeat protein [Legionella sainthelensi]VEH37293.1 NHL repeat protein [Legionella sainthelensi]
MNGNYLKNFLLIGASGLFVISPIHAGIPVWTFNPLTKTNISLPSNNTAIVQYAVTNQSKKRALNLRMKPIVGVQATGCTDPLPSHQSCTLTLTIDGSMLTGNIIGGPILCERGNPNQCYQPSAENQLVIKKTANTQIKVGAGNFLSSLNSGMLAVKEGASGNWNFPIGNGYTLTSTSCSGTGSSAICTAVGNYYGIASGVVFVSQNGGSTWSQASSGISNAASYYGTSCSGSFGSTVCTAVGRDSQQNLLISVSHDGGTTWNKANIPNTRGRFNTTSCTGSGNSAICIAAGQSLVNPSPNSILYVSTDGGFTWGPVPIAATGFNLLGSSCSGFGNNALCVATGLQISGSGPAALYVSRDGGQTWVGKPTPANSQFNKISCVGDKSLGVCVAAGQNLATKKALMYSSIDGGQNWTPQSFPENNSIFNDVSCSIGTSYSSILCAAVGRDNAASLPLVYTSTINAIGLTWNKKTTTTTDSIFNGVSCTGSATTATCAAGGQNITQGNSLLYISKDGGATWSLEPTGDSPGTFAAVSCVGIGDSLVCSAAGNITPSPLIYQSVNNGSSWNIIDLPSKAGTFSSISCTGSGMDAVCAAAGIDNKGNVPLLYLGTPSTNLSWNWNQVQTGITAQGRFTNVSCTGSGKTSICTAVGNFGTASVSGSGAPIIYVTRNGGISWSLIGTNSSLTKVFLNDSSCTGSGDTAVCVAAGQNFSIPSWPSLLMKSLDGGQTWTQVNTGITNQALNGAGCSGNGSSAVCIATGQDYVSGNPLIYLSQDGGTNWNTVDTASISDNAYFNDANCSGLGVKTVCTASGQDVNTGYALMYYTENAGQTWTQQQPLTVPAQGNSILYQTSCTGDASQAVCASAGLYTGDYPSYIYLGLANSSPILWSLITPSNYTGFLSTAHCSGLGSAATCMIGGGEVNLSSTPLIRPSLYITSDAGKSWSPVSIDSSVIGGQFNGLASDNS